jgi:hypothetical protein
VTESRPRPKLQEAVDELYAVFAAYPLGNDTHPCPHCITPEEERALRI